VKNDAILIGTMIVEHLSAKDGGSFWLGARIVYISLSAAFRNIVLAGATPDT
jgi:hypothetical protein